MAHIKVIHDPAGETLTVYWDDTKHEEVCEGVGHRLILIKDAQGESLGLSACTSSQKLLPRNKGQSRCPAVVSRRDWQDSPWSKWR